MAIQITQVPNSMFCAVTKVRDIRQAFFLPKKEVKAGEPDVMLVSPLGYYDRVNRVALVKLFTTPDGKKIKISHWKYGKKYLVVTNENIQMYALRVPNNTKVKIVMPNHKEAVKGVYIVCPRGQNGEIVKSTPFVVKYPLFHRMFRIDKKATMDASKVKELIKKTDVKTPKAGSKNAPITIKEELSNKKYFVVARVVRPDNGKTVGFVVSDGKVSKKLNKDQVTDMCRLKQLRNLTVVYQEGKEFLRGVGIRIENLPATPL